MAGWAPGTGTFIDARGVARGPQVLATDANGSTYGSTIAGAQQYQSDLARVNTAGQQMEMANLANRLGSTAGAAVADARGRPIQAGMVGIAPVAGASIQMGGFDASQRAQAALAAQGGQAIAGLQRAATGAVPSAAELQGRIQLQQAQANAMAMGASARGGADARAAAQRQALQTGAGMSGQVIAQQAALRAQEQAAARAQLAGAIGQQQGLAQGQGAQAAQMAQAQAGMQQQAALANQGAALQAAQGNQAASLDAQQAQQAALLNARQLELQGIGQAAGAWQNSQQMAMAGADFNNQVGQTDFNRQMAMQGQLIQRYGIDKGVAAQVYQADQARAASDRMATAQMVGAGFNAVGSLTGAFANYAAKSGKIP